MPISQRKQLNAVHSRNRKCWKGMLDVNQALNERVGYSPTQENRFLCHYYCMISAHIQVGNI
jgi:hypothetical protein